MQHTNTTEDHRTLCSCGRRADGIDAETRSPSCRQCAGSTTTDDEQNRAIADGGMQRQRSLIPESAEHMTADTLSAVIAGPNNDRQDIIDQLRDRIGTDYQSERLRVEELADLLAVLHKSEVNV